MVLPRHLTENQIRIFNTNVKAILLYGSETWRTTKQTSQKLQSFVNKCLRRILNISWTDRVTNEMLWELAGKEPIITQISKRKWRWIDQILRKPADSITRQALRWNPQGKRKRGPQELLEKRCRVPNEKLGPHLGHFRKTCPGQNSMEDGCG